MESSPANQEHQQSQEDISEKIIKDYLPLFIAKGSESSLSSLRLNSQSRADIFSFYNEIPETVLPSLYFYGDN